MRSKGTAVIMVSEVPLWGLQHSYLLPQLLLLWTFMRLTNSSRQTCLPGNVESPHLLPISPTVHNKRLTFWKWYMFVQINVSDLILAEVLVDFELNGVWYDILLCIMILVDKASHKVLCQRKYIQPEYGISMYTHPQRIPLLKL